MDVNEVRARRPGETAEREASREKALAAERYVSRLRALVIALNVAVYYTIFDRSLGVPWLANATVVVAILYAAAVILYEPYRRFPVLASAGFTAVTDAGLITAWVFASGGFESPYYLLWYVSLAAVAFRFNYRTTVLVAGLYALMYGGLLLATGEFFGNEATVLIRLGYIGIMGLLGGLLSKETFEQTKAKVRMRGLAFEARRAEARLRRSEAELKANLSLQQATFESTADGLLVVDQTGRITGFNGRFAEMWRIPEEVIASRDDNRALAFVLDQLKDAEGFVAKVRELYANPEAESFDVLEFKDGQVFERYSRPQRLDGQSVGRVWSFRDVTAARKSEREKVTAMERAKEVEQLKEIDAFKTHFINSVAHELWTPLTPIKLQLHLLRTQKTGRISRQQERSMEVIERNMDRLIRLVEEMLEGARLQAGRFKVQLAPMDLSSTVQEMVDLFDPMSEATGVGLNGEVETGLWVQGDATRIVQVLYNLLSNAFKYTPRGGNVRVSLEQAGTTTILAVRDTGIGIEAEEQSRLFQAFSQVHATGSSVVGGTGLGLYISRAIVDAHGGLISCDSAGHGKGTTFAVRLPLLSKGTPEGLPSAPAAKAQRIPARGVAATV